MEANTVVLNLGVYNSLKEFNDKITKGNTYRCVDYSSAYSGYNGYYLPAITWITTDEAIKEVIEINEKLGKKIEELQSELVTLKTPPKTKEITITDVKKMSIWEFRKWKKQR